MTKKKYIDTYNTVYGVDIVVVNKNVTLKELRETYCYSNGEELNDSIKDAAACTARCKNKKTNRYCSLIVHNHDSLFKDADKRTDLINTAAHEALHSALDILTYAGEESINPNDPNETLAYFVGWITEKMYKTWTKK